MACVINELTTEEYKKHGKRNQKIKKLKNGVAKIIKMQK